jgi:hypothetical protein
LEDRVLPSVSVTSSFKGLDTNDAGGIIEPPDTIAAAGPNHIVEIVNSNIAFYNKSNGQQVFTTDLGTFFAPVDSVDFLLSDVYVTYDEQVGKWFVSTMDIDFDNLVSYFDFAISNDSDPTHGFSEMHQIDDTEISPRTGEQLFTDFPRVGWNADAYVVSFDMFGFFTEFPYNVQLLTINKSSVTDGNPATLSYTQVDRPAPNSTMVPATMHGSKPGDPMWFVEEKGLEQNGDYHHLRIVKETNVLSPTPTFKDYYLSVAPYTITPFPSDPNAQITTAIDTRILSVDWRTNNMAVSQSVGLSKDTVVHARWYEIGTGGTAPTLIQQGSISRGPTTHTFMPAVALGTDGSIGMTFIESGDTENMSMYVTGRLSTDKLGSMQKPVLVKAGEQSYQGTRAGDFSGITVDPLSGTSYWAANEYAIVASDPTVPNWGTWIAGFTMTSGALRLEPPPSTPAGHTKPPSQEPPPRPPHSEEVRIDASQQAPALTGILNQPGTNYAYFFSPAELGMAGSRFLAPALGVPILNVTPSSEASNAASPLLPSASALPGDWFWDRAATMGSGGAIHVLPNKGSLFAHHGTTPGALLIGAGGWDEAVLKALAFGGWEQM